MRQLLKTSTRTVCRVRVLYRSCRGRVFRNGELEVNLRSLAEGALPRFKRPRKYVFVSDLPYTATGKIQRFKLRQRTKESSPTSTLVRIKR